MKRRKGSPRQLGGLTRAKKILDNKTKGTRKLSSFQKLFPSRDFSKPEKRKRIAEFAQISENEIFKQVDNEVKTSLLFDALADAADFERKHHCVFSHWNDAKTIVRQAFQ